MSPQALNQPTKCRRSSKTMKDTTFPTTNRRSNSDPTTRMTPRGQFPPLDAAQTPKGPRTPPTNQSTRHQGSSKTMTDRISPPNNQPFHHGSAAHQPPRGHFAPLEAGQAPFVPRQPPRPNRIILPPDAHQRVSITEFLRKATGTTAGITRMSQQSRE